jgi:hypothetical protein
MDAIGSDAAEAGLRQAPSLALLRAHTDEILRLAARRGVSNIMVFGSVARGDATPDSDIDLLVDFQVGESGLDLIAFAEDGSAPWIQGRRGDRGPPGGPGSGRQAGRRSVSTTTYCTLPHR